MEQLFFIKPYRLIIIIFLSVFISCNNAPQTPKVENPSDTTANGKASPLLAATTPGNFYKLRLNSAQYAKFKDIGNRCKQLILVFNYPVDAYTNYDGSPQLDAYAVGNGHNDLDVEPEKLAYEEKSDVPISGRMQYLGNLQISMDDLEDVLEEATGSRTGAFEYFLFTPKYGTDTGRPEDRDRINYIYYDVSVKREKGTPLLPGVKATNPCPPANSL